MKIIVVQGEDIVLRMVNNAVNCFNPGRASEILFTSFPAKVLEEMKEHEDVLIISGQKFHDGSTGVELARMVKSIKPEALFFIFSSTHEPSKDVDGYIHKLGGNEMALAKIIASDLTADTAKESLSAIQEN